MTVDLTGCSINEYTLIKLIGSGAYGLVYLVENKYTGLRYAMKCIHKKPVVNHSTTTKQSDYLYHELNKVFQTQQHLHQLNLNKLKEIDINHLKYPFLKEISIHLQVCDHPNVITIHQILDSKHLIFIMMDYFPESDLFINIVDKQIYTQSQNLIKKVFIQLLDVISYLHSKGIYHCDIKPENIMCCDNGEHLVLGDFGLAVKSAFIKSQTCIGSSYYMPPERLTNLNHQLTRKEYPADKGDLWSLSIILINLSCIRNPWMKACDTDATYKAFKEKPEVLKDILNISDELYDILKDCLKEEPDDRISLFELRSRVISCSKLTQTGPLSVVNKNNICEYNECLIPNDTFDQDDDEEEEDFNKSMDINNGEVINHISLPHYNDLVKNLGDNFSIMTNKSFDMNGDMKVGLMF